MTVAGVTGRKSVCDVSGKKGEDAMCTIWEEIEKTGLEKGRAKGLIEGQAQGMIEMGLEYGLSESEILKRLQKKLKISEQEAEKYFERFARQMV